MTEGTAEHPGADRAAVSPPLFARVADEVSIYEGARGTGSRTRRR